MIYDYSSQHIEPLILTNVPVVTLSSVTENGIALVQGTDFEIEARSGLLWRLSNGSRCSWTASNTVVSYTSGYVLPQDMGTRTLPYDIEDAALSLIKGSYFGRSQNPSVILEVTEGVGRTQYAPSGSAIGINDAVKLQLQPYKVWVW